MKSKYNKLAVWITEFLYDTAATCTSKTTWNGMNLYDRHSGKLSLLVNYSPARKMIAL